jgi:hypothetical protein
MQPIMQDMQDDRKYLHLLLHPRGYLKPHKPIHLELLRGVTSYLP